MYPTDFAYHRPATIAESVALLQGDGNDMQGDIKLLAGGQSLLPLMKLRLAEPATLVDIGRIPALQGIRDEGDALVIGATTPYYQVLDAALVQRRCPLLIEVLRQVGDLQVRTRGTVGGSLAHADPAGDLPAAAMALEATLDAQGPNGSRSIPASEFFVDLLTTALEPAEVLTTIHFPVTDAPRTGVAYHKHRNPASGYAVVGIAAIVRLGKDGTIAGARVGITGAGTHATRATQVERALTGQPATAETLAAASQHASDGLDLMSDPYASAEYRAHLTRVLTRRALEEAADTARANTDTKR